MPERRFAADPASVSAARAFVATQLASDDAGLVDRVLLLVSELASNSVRHAQSAFVLHVERDAGAIRVSVHDDGDGRPQVRHPAPSDPSGRGLQIVAALSDEWGVDADGPGKSVWFVVRTGTVGRATDVRASVDSDR